MPGPGGRPGLSLSQFELSAYMPAKQPSGSWEQQDTPSYLLPSVADAHHRGEHHAILFIELFCTERHGFDQQWETRPRFSLKAMLTQSILQAAICMLHDGTACSTALVPNRAKTLWPVGKHRACFKAALGG